MGDIAVGLAVALDDGDEAEAMAVEQRLPVIRRLDRDPVMEEHDAGQLGADRVGDDRPVRHVGRQLERLAAA